MDQNENNTNSPVPVTPTSPVITPQVFGVQQQGNPGVPSTAGSPQVYQQMAAPQPSQPQPGAQMLSGSPSPIGGQIAPDVPFTSNPFLSFGKGLGSGLFYSPGTIICAGALITILFLGLSILGGIVSGLLSAVNPFLGILGFIVVFVLGLVFGELLFARTIIAFHKSGQSESITFRETGTLVTIGTAFSLLGLTIITGLIVLVGSILLIIPGLILWSRLSLAPFALVVEKTGVFASLSRSWSLTKHHTWDMLGANIVQFIGGGSSILLTTAIYAAAANRYSELTERERHGATDRTKTHWSNYLMTIVVFLLIAAYFLFIGFLLTVTGVQKTSLLKNTNQNSSSSTTTTFTTDTTTPTGKYCYYNGGINDSNAKYVCTDSKTDCVANQFCKTDNSYQLN